MNQNMTFEELVNENVRLNDKRRKVFKDLRAKVKDELLPALCKALEDSDKTRCYIEFENKPFELMNGCDEEWGKVYIIYFYADGEIKEGITGYDGYGRKVHESRTKNYDIDDLRSDAVIELAVSIKEKIEKLNKRISLQIEKAEEQLND